MRPFRACLALVTICLAGIAAAAPASTRELSAVRLSQLAAEQFRLGHFQETARLLREAYDTYPEPILLHNLGRALDSDGDLAGAIAAYRQYLDAEKGAVDRGSIERRIETLQQQLAEREEIARQREAERLRLAEERAAAERSRPRADSGSVSKARRAAPWAVLGIGGLTLLTGATLGGVARATRDDAAGIDVSAADAQTGLDSARSYALGANVCFGIGGVVAGAGLIWGVVDIVKGRRARAPEPSLSAVR